jgi:chromosome segregation ATPase
MDEADDISHSRTAAVTVNVLKEYKEMITNTTSDLEDHLQEIDNKLQTLSLQGARMSDEDAAERERIQEERDSTKQCLRVCAQVSEHMDQVQPNAFEDVSTASDAHQAIVATLGDNISARRVTTNVFKECKEKLTNTTSELEEHLREINNRLQSLSPRAARMSGEQAAEQERIQEEKDCIKQCLAICAQASEQADQVRTNVFEDVSTAQDAHQLVVATLGDLISARRVTAGVRSTQWLGQMSDDTVQQLSRDRGRVTMEKATEPQSGMVEEFEDRYGAGYKLSSACLTTRRRSLPTEKVN